LLLLILIQTQFVRMHYTVGNPALFINGQRSVVKSHPEDRKYLCRFHPCNEILMRLYEIIKPGKKQKTRPDPTYRESISIAKVDECTFALDLDFGSIFL
jgi:hypothetical protein